MLRPEYTVEDHELMQAHGEAIRRLMSEPVVKTLFNELEQRYVRMWKASVDVDERELVHAKACALSDLEAAFQAVIDAGTLATRHLER